MTQRTALVTGGNRGIGLAICRALARGGLRVVLTARSESEGRTAAAELAADGRELTSYPLDVADPAAITACQRRLANDGMAVDVLINNAAIYPVGNALEIAAATIEEAWAVNARGPWLLCSAFMPAMVRRGYGRIVNISSGGGSFAQGLATDHVAYAVTKAALNALTVSLAQSVTGNVKVNAMCPGWVRTRMGGAAAPRSPEDAADTAVWLATLPADGPSGGFFRDRAPIAW